MAADERTSGLAAAVDTSSTATETQAAAAVTFLADTLPAAGANTL